MPSVSPYDRSEFYPETCDGPLMSFSYRNVTAEEAVLNRSSGWMKGVLLPLLPWFKLLQMEHLKRGSIAAQFLWEARSHVAEWGSMSTSRGCSQGVDPGRSHLRDLLGLENLFPWWLIHVIRKAQLPEGKIWFLAT